MVRLTCNIYIDTAHKTRKLWAIYSYQYFVEIADLVELTSDLHRNLTFKLYTRKILVYYKSARIHRFSDVESNIKARENEWVINFYYQVFDSEVLGIGKKKKRKEKQFSSPLKKLIM